jgi:hypothetical protein
VCHSWFLLYCDGEWNGDGVWIFIHDHNWIHKSCWRSRGLTFPRCALLYSLLTSRLSLHDNCFLSSQ